MQGPGTIPLDACIKSVAIVVSYACAGEVCITLFNRNFVRFIDRKQTMRRSLPDYGCTFIPVSCSPFCTDAGMRNWFELCGFRASHCSTVSISDHAMRPVVAVVVVIQKIVYSVSTLPRFLSSQVPMILSFYGLRTLSLVNDLVRKGSRGNAWSYAPSFACLRRRTNDLRQRTAPTSASPTVRRIRA